ncbi:hypothetical protein [Stenotrophomonas sp.]|uniref:hypothetical protein n=1 Tax=Stenotrophomonas sp. TaxID=69392 RepID=UPI0031E09C7D
MTPDPRDRGEQAAVDLTVWWYDQPCTVFYLASPYWETEGYGVDFLFSAYEAMVELMRVAAGRFVVSINDQPQIRDVFAGFDLAPLQLH